MNKWLRLRPFDPTTPEQWHMWIATSQNGLSMAQCGYTYVPHQLVEIRTIRDVPLTDTCEPCQQSYTQLVGSTRGGIGTPA